MRHLVRAAALSAIALFMARAATADDVSGAQTPQADAMPKMDANGDGVVTDAERDAARAEWKELIATHFDTNGDGVISDAERKAGRARIEKRRKALRAKYDADGDGRLDEAERKVAREDGAIPDFDHEKKHHDLGERAREREGRSRR
jgi:hypothetical protein